MVLHHWGEFASALINFVTGSGPPPESIAPDGFHFGDGVCPVVLPRNISFPSPFAGFLISMEFLTSEGHHSMFTADL